MEITLNCRIQVNPAERRPRTAGARSTGQEDTLTDGRGPPRRSAFVRDLLRGLFCRLFSAADDRFFLFYQWPHGFAALYTGGAEINRLYQPVELQFLFLKVRLEKPLG